MKSWWSFSGSQLWLTLISAYLSALVIAPVSAQVKSQSNIHFPTSSELTDLLKVGNVGKGGLNISNSRRIRQLTSITNAQPLLAQSPVPVITEVTSFELDDRKDNSRRSH